MVLQACKNRRETVLATNRAFKDNGQQIDRPSNDPEEQELLPKSLRKVRNPILCVLIYLTNIKHFPC